MASKDLVDKFILNYYPSHFEHTATIVEVLCDRALRDADDGGSQKIQYILSRRAKTRESLQKKVEKMLDEPRREGDQEFETEEQISQSIHDRAGVRIALYFPNQIDLVG